MLSGKLLQIHGGTTEKVLLQLVISNRWLQHHHHFTCRINKISKSAREPAYKPQQTFAKYGTTATIVHALIKP